MPKYMGWLWRRMTKTVMRCDTPGFTARYLVFTFILSLCTYILWCMCYRTALYSRMVRSHHQDTCVRACFRALLQAYPDLCHRYDLQSKQVRVVVIVILLVCVMYLHNTCILLKHGYHYTPSSSGHRTESPDCAVICFFNCHHRLSVPLSTAEQSLRR